MKFLRRLFCSHDYERKSDVVSDYLDHAYCHCTYTCKRCGKSYQKFEWLKYKDSYIREHPLDTSIRFVERVVTDWKYFYETGDYWKLAIAQEFIMKHGNNDQRQWLINRLHIHNNEHKWI